MNKITKIIIVAALMSAVVLIIALKEKNPGDLDSAITKEIVNETETPKALPKLIDLGADKCIPCKAMAPILEELRAEYKDKLEVTFIDVRKKPEQAKKYKINLIPTQIFYDSSGKEQFRHEGFFSKEDILNKCSELGFDLDKQNQDN